MSPDAAEASRWRGAERLLGIVAALLLVALTLLTCIDVIGRYFLDRPLTGAFELTELAMGALVFSSLPLVSLHRQQVTVDLFEWLIPRAWRRVQNAIIDLSAAACVGVIAWQLWRRAVNMAAAGETTATLQIPVYPLVGYMALLAGVTVVLMLAMAWTDATGKAPR
ncbi:MAG: TRAP transporter small permease [Rubrivivax sp.]|nr:TRAP transporter small permease [Rubrivivax sp.]MBK7262292.1 TRAP transporter small permease [Rubrivivax sp.]